VVKEYEEIEGDVIFTDSFSPPDWENPVMRKRIITGDRDIGEFIQPDVIEPKLRKLDARIKLFLNNVRDGKVEKQKDLLSRSAYNSFKLRYSELIIEDPFTVRVAIPENLKVNKFWVPVKILFPTRSISSKIEVEYTKQIPVITDFENKLLDEIKINQIKEKESEQEDDEESSDD